MGGVLPLGALFRLAWRNLWRNHRRTLVMLMAVLVGAWAMIFMTALMRGMVDQMVEDGIDALPGQVQVHHADFRDDPSIENRIPEPGPGFATALETPPAGGWTARVHVPPLRDTWELTRDPFDHPAVEQLALRTANLPPDA